MAVRSTNTFAEALERMLTDLAQMKLLPDADMELISAMEEAIIGWYREPIDNAQQQGLTSVMSSPADIPPEMMAAMGGGGMPGGMPGGVGASQIAGAGARGMPGGGGAGAPNPDELRRVLGGAAGLR